MGEEEGERMVLFIKTLFTFTSLSLGFGVIFKENQHFRSFSSGIMTEYNLNHLLLKEGLGFRELYLIEFLRISREFWSRIHYMLKGCQLRAFTSHFVKFLYFTSSKCYFSTLTNHFYNTTHIPLLILLLLYLYILVLFFILMLFLSLTPLSLSLSLSLSICCKRNQNTTSTYAISRLC